MWMMDYNEPHDQHHLKINMNMLESFTNNGCRKFKPLTPPPTSTAASTGHQNHLHPLNHHLMAAQRNKIELNSSAEAQMVVVSSRWNPTPEQLQTLEELYRRGTRTPSSDEIQRITTQLRRYGKIEGKNVFYWFQNHKARERQKRRRQQQQLHNPATKEIHQPPLFYSSVDQSVQHKDSEVEETRNWGMPTYTEKRVVVERRGQKESSMTNTDEEGMISCVEQQGNNDHELLLLHQRRRNIIWNNMMHSLSSSSNSLSSSSNNNHHHITIDPNTLTTTAATSTSVTVPTLIVSSHYHQQHPHEVDCCETLELFPVNHYGHGKEQPEKCLVPMSDIGLGHRQFIEFLPLKN